MNVNLINDVNLTTSHQSELVEKDSTNKNNDCFQQLLRLSENQAEQNKKTINAKLNVIDDVQEDNDVEMLITAIYPFNIQIPEQEKQAFLSTVQDGDIIKKHQNTEILNVNLFDNLPPKTLINEQGKHLLTSILNDRNEMQNDSDFIQKLAVDRTQFITNNHDNDGKIQTNQESFLLTNTNGQNQLLSPTSISARSATINLPTQNIMQWQTSLTEQIIMFNRQGIQTAEIKLHPQELGSMYIKLAMNDDKMNLHMMAAHSAVKGMLESALPFLRTSLEDQGITLEQTNIGDFSMMNDSKQSDTPQQTKSNQTQKVVSLDVVDDSIEHPLVESRSIKSRLSIFA